MNVKFGHILCGVVAALFIAGAGVSAQAGDLAGTWELNYPSVVGTPVVWEFEETGSTFSGSSFIQIPMGSIASEMSGSSLLGRIYFGRSQTTVQPANKKTSGLVLFTVDGEELSGIYIDTFMGIPIGFGDLTGNRLLLVD